jgi:TPR repeat protein
MSAVLLTLLGLVRGDSPASSDYEREQAPVSQSRLSAAPNADQLYREARMQMCKEKGAPLDYGTRARELMLEAAEAGSLRAAEALNEFDLLAHAIGGACLEGSLPRCGPNSGEERRQREAKQNEDWLRIMRDLDRLVELKEPCALSTKAQIVLWEKSSSTEEQRGAREMMIDAAVMGCKNAWFFLGDAYAGGSEGFPMNQEQSAYWYDKAMSALEEERALYCGKADEATVPK